MTQRYAVPEEGLKALHAGMCQVIPRGAQQDYERAGLEAFIRWQSEHYDVIPKGDGNAKTDQKSA